MANVLTKRRLGLFVLFLLITAGLTMPATADKKTRVQKTRVPAEQMPGLLIGQWKGSFVFGIPQISLDITSVQGGKIRGVGHEFGSKCTGPYEIRGEITEKGWIIYTRLPTESCPELVFKLKMYRTNTGDLLIASWGSWRGPAKTYMPGLIRVSATPGAVRQPSEAASLPQQREQTTRSSPYNIAIFPFESNTGCIGRSRPSHEKFAAELGALITRNDSLKLAYSYYDKDLNQPPIKKPGRLWAGSKPNVARVSSLGKTHRVDAVVMYWRAATDIGYCTDQMPPFSIYVYIIDVKQRKTYWLKGREKNLSGMTEQAFSKFIAARPKVVLAKATPSEPTTVTPTPPPKKKAVTPTVATAGAKSVTLPAGTTLTVELAENLHSEFNSFGEIVLMKTTEDVKVDGQTAISRSAPVRVEISNIIKLPYSKYEFKLSAVSVETVDGQWLALDTHYFSAGDSPHLSRGCLCELRGAQYEVTISRDAVINTATTNAPPSLKKADLYTEAAFKESPEVIKFHKFSKSEPGKNFILKIALTPDMAAIVQDEPDAVAVVKILDDILLKPINPFFVKLDLARIPRILTAAFYWWPVIKWVRPGQTPMTVQLTLADGRLVQAETILETDWKLK